MTQPGNLVWIVAVAMLAGCTTVPVNLPSVTEQPTSNRLPGKIIWHDLLTGKPNETRRFYEELFGWEFERIGPDFGAIASANCTLIRDNGRLIGGMIDESKLDNDPQVYGSAGVSSGRVGSGGCSSSPRMHGSISIGGRIM